MIKKFMATLLVGVFNWSLPAKHTEDWGLDDPTGKSDDEFKAVIYKIEEEIKELMKKINEGAVD
jgi:arsenate reductase